MSEPDFQLGVSVIIPLAPGEDTWRDLAGDLTPLPAWAELILVGTTAPPADFPQLSPDGGDRWRWVESSPGRAVQLNAGAAAAQRPFLWFLHADSRFADPPWDALRGSLTARPDALHYFNLTFQKDGPLLMPFNAWGAWLRSHLFGMPFGDQGLCLAAEQFRAIGGYDEAARLGEDHLFVWSARHHGLRLRCTGATLATSARKYRRSGWGRTTLLHFYHTWRQALPAWGTLLRKRWFS